METFASGHALRVLLLFFVLCLGSWGPLASNSFSSPSLPTFLSGQAHQKHPASTHSSLSDLGFDPYVTPNKRSRILHSISDDALNTDDYFSSVVVNFDNSHLKLKEKPPGWTTTTEDTDLPQDEDLPDSQEFVNASSGRFVADNDIPAI